MKVNLTYRKFEKVLVRHPSILSILDGIQISSKDFTTSQVDIDHINNLLAKEAEKCTYIYPDFKENLYQIAENIRKDKSGTSDCNERHLQAMVLTLQHCPNNNELPDDLSGAIALSIMINSLNQQGTDELMNNEETLKVFTSTLTKILQMATERTLMPSKLLYDFHLFLKQQTIPLSVLILIIECLILIAVEHYMMIPSVTICCEDDAPGFLAFVCLSVILGGKYNQNLEFESRQELVYHIFHSVENTLSNVMLRRSLTLVQQGTVQWNFRALMRQVKDDLCLQPKAPAFAFIKLSRVFPRSKNVVFSINQLSFDAYKMVIDLAVKTAKMDYNGDCQAFCYNLLQSPYIPEEPMDMSVLISRLTEGVLWGFRTNNFDITVKTGEYLQNILHLEDLDTYEMLQHFLREHPFFHATNVLNYIYQFCNVNWNTKIKRLNQMFIVCTCRVYLLIDGISENSFEQIRLLVSTADIEDLIPCITTFMHLLKKTRCPQTKLVGLIFDKLVKNALSPSMTYGVYLEAIFSMFHDPNIAIIMFDIGIDLPTLVKHMIKQRLINAVTLKPLFDAMPNNLSLWQLAEVILPLMPRIKPPESIYQYWDMIKMDKLIWQMPNTSIMVSIVGKYVEHTIEAHRKEENVFFNELLVFILNSLRARKVPAAYSTTALVAAGSLIKYTGRHETDFLNYFNELERTITHNLQNAVAEGETNMSGLQIVTREIHYYGDFCMAFSKYKGFNADRRGMESIINGLSLIDHTNLELVDMIEALVRCATKLTMRYKTDGTLVTRALEIILSHSEVISDRLSVLALVCYADIATTCTRNFQYLLPEIFNFIESEHYLARQQAVKILWRLIEGEFIKPTNWQMYALAHNFLDIFVAKTCDYQWNEDMRSKVEKYVGRYFIHIMVYFNEFYEHPSYYLSPGDQLKLPGPGIPLDKRHIIYRFILEAYPKYGSFHVLREVYKNVVDKFSALPLKYPKNYELLQDIITVTYLCTRQDNRHFPKNKEMDYTNAISMLGQLSRLPVTYERPKTEVDTDDLVKIVLTALFKFLSKLNHQSKTILPELLHVMLAVSEWYRPNLIGLLIDGGRGGPLRRMLGQIPDFFATNRRFFHFERATIVPTPEPIDNSSVYYRF